MIKLLIIIGVLIPTAYAEGDDTLYKKFKTAVELESRLEEATLPDQRFAIGIYHDDEIDTNDLNNEIVPFEIKKEDYVDYSLRMQVTTMCGDDEMKNDLFMCIMVQDRLTNIVSRNVWLRKLGRDLQAIVTGYEMGIDGYPGKPVDIIGRFSSIMHLWRAANDTYTQPFVETLTQARTLPPEIQDELKEDSQAIVESLKELIRTWTADEEDAEEKKDKDDMAAAIRRYRHGVQYVIDREGACEDAEEYPENPANVWLERRWCDLEEDLIEIRDKLQTDDVEFGNDEHILYPSFVDQESNIFIWMRYDDVGLQWYVQIEPVQAALYHPNYGDCIEGDTPKNCYNTYSEFLVRGGKYPSKLGEEEKEDQPFLSLDTEGQDPNNGSENDDEETEEEKESNNAVVPEPKEGDGVCSHPYGRNGYLCRVIEYEACDLTNKQEEELQVAGTGGIVLTRCQPERFKNDVARRVSGSNICGIGGWKETVEANLVEDTAEEQLDMRPTACANCAIDVICKDVCREDATATTSFFRRHDVIEICVNKTGSGIEQPYYLLAHELTHAQLMCDESTLQTLERTGNDVTDPPSDKEAAAGCCASEREAYFVQCKMFALDGILDKALITIDQCASAYANFSCHTFDDDPNDDDQVCTNDGIDPDFLLDTIGESITKMLEDGSLDIPETCEDSLEDPRIKAFYNSYPLSCKPGCQSKYQNTIGNNICFTGQCIEETHERARDIPGRMSLTVVDQGFPWDSCELPDPDIGEVEAPPAITPPIFPLYRPALMLQELDHALCQINGLPARTPPILCGFDHTKRLGLPPLTFIQSIDDIRLQPKEYEATGLGIQYAASAIGSRVATDMFTIYLNSGARQFADILNTMYHILNQVGDIEFPSQMCSRYSGNAGCPQ